MELRVPVVFIWLSILVGSMLSNILVPCKGKDVLIYVNQVRVSALMLKIAQKKFCVRSQH